MNSKAKNFKTKKCVICEFPFSDDHHIIPQHKNICCPFTICLCPNHHRLAHIVQTFVSGSYGVDAIEVLIDAVSDAKFTEYVPTLITEQCIFERIFANRDKTVTALEAWANERKKKPEAE